MDIQQVASKVSRDERGIWHSKDIATISYPEKGNENCLLLEENSFWFEHRNRCIISAINLLPPDGPLFDIGGGNGYASCGLAKAGIEVVLVEPGLQGAINARKRGLQHVICASLEGAGFAPESMHAAGIFDVLEHIEDHDAFLKSIYEFIRPGGKLYITVPAYNFLWSGEDISAGHFRRYTLSGLEAVLLKNGFVTEFSSYFFFFLPLPIFLLRTIPGWFGQRKDIDISIHKKEHSKPRYLGGLLLDSILDFESQKIAKGRKIPFGGSCLVSAVKH